MSDEKKPIEFVDRRQLKRDAESADAAGPQLVKTKAAAEVEGIRRYPHPECTDKWGDKLRWIEITYMVTMMAVGDGNMIIVGRCVGLRSDGIPCVANYIFNGIYSDVIDWQKIARDRIEPFLTCECDIDTPCQFHMNEAPLWIQEGLLRLKKMKEEPLPEPIKALNWLEREVQAQIDLVNTTLTKEINKANLRPM